jgi:hypothetical protein
VRLSLEPGHVALGALQVWSEQENGGVDLHQLRAVATDLPLKFRYLAFDGGALGE